MGKRGFGSKRRTVLQLGDEPRKQPSYGLGYKTSDGAPAADGAANALSGLMSHYAQDSGSDSESDNEASPATATSVESAGTSFHSKSSHSSLPFQKFVAATDTSLPPAVSQPDLADQQVAHKELKSASEPAVVPTDDIDTKLQDFLAEIESIELKKEQTADDFIDGVPMAMGNELATVQQSFTADCQSANGAANGSSMTTNVASDDDDDFKLSKPREPTTKWQQCLDEETQCYYYWHTDTNEVTWEIPPEYSQFLLRYAEYEKTKAHYDKELADWKKAHPNRKPKTSKKKHRKHTKKSEDVCIPIVSYPPDDEEPVVQGPIQGPVFGPPLPVIGPALIDTAAHGAPPLPADDQDKYEISLAQACDAPGQVLELEMDRVPQDAPSISASSAYIVSSASEVSVLSDYHRASIGPQKDLNSRVLELKQVAGESDGSAVSDSEAGGLSSLKALHDKFVRRTAKFKDQGGTNVLKHSNGHKSPDNRETPGISDDKKSLEATSGLDSYDTSASKTSRVSGVDDDDEYVRQMLEEPVFVRYEYINKKYDVTDDYPPEITDAEPFGKKRSSMELDTEEIDNELERALVQKTMVTAEHDGFASKRKADEDMSERMPTKKMKSYVECSSSNLQVRQSINDDIKQRADDLAEVADLASTVTDKLDFLEVKRTDLSKLQILLLQIETRIEDWRAGALSTERLLLKLRESCATLRQYESSATPPGWSCHWHRYDLFGFNWAVLG